MWALPWCRRISRSRYDWTTASNVSSFRQRLGAPNNSRRLHYQWAQRCSGWVGGGSSEHLGSSAPPLAGGRQLDRSDGSPFHQRGTQDHLWMSSGHGGEAMVRRVYVSRG